MLFAFESGFELIISILDSEGWTDGGIIVLDCLRLATLILDDNTNTQSFFREMGFLHKESDFLYSPVQQENPLELNQFANMG